AQVVHGDVGEIVLLADVVDGDDVGMAEAAGGFGLAEEARLHFLQRLAVELVGQRQRLDGNLAADARIDAEIHHAHGTAAELAVVRVALDARRAAAVGGQGEGVVGSAAAAAQGLALQRLHALDAAVDVRVQRGNRRQVPV